MSHPECRVLVLRHLPFALSGSWLCAPPPGKCIGSDPQCRSHCLLQTQSLFEMSECLPTALSEFKLQHVPKALCTVAPPTRRARLHSGPAHAPPLSLPRGCSSPRLRWRPGLQARARRDPLPEHLPFLCAELRTPVILHSQLVIRHNLKETRPDLPDKVTFLPAGCHPTAPLPARGSTPAKVLGLLLPLISVRAASRGRACHGDSVNINVSFMGGPPDRRMRGAPGERERGKSRVSSGFSLPSFIGLYFCFPALCFPVFQSYLICSQRCPRSSVVFPMLPTPESGRTQIGPSFGSFPVVRTPSLRGTSRPRLRIPSRKRVFRRNDSLLPVAHRSSSKC